MHGDLYWQVKGYMWESTKVFQHWATRHSPTALGFPETESFPKEPLTQQFYQAQRADQTFVGAVLLQKCLLL